MALEMEFRLLGPLVVRHGEQVVPVPRGKQRVLLAALLLHANRVVSIDDLTETLWGSRPPPSARVTLQNYVKRLRQSLLDSGRAVISSQPPGYLIRVTAGDLDVWKFEELVEAAQAAARESSWESVVSLASAALDLWRGEPLADVESEGLTQQAAPRLREMKLRAEEMRIDACLNLGRHADAISKLLQLVAENPLRERFHALLMITLYRDGRHAEALAAYRRVRELLVEELGTEPGTELRELHQRMLALDPALGILKAEPVTARAPVRVVPRELPPDVSGFTGRAAELAELDRLASHVGHGAMAGNRHSSRNGAALAHGAVIAVSAVSGTAGVGKTALAVRWAHQISRRFPDGQLYANLRGYDAARPVSAAEALAGFLRALGVPGEDIPAGVDERAARYRSLLADRRVLVVLDNVVDADQVRPLLPGGSGCVAVITSRDALAGLVARDGARRLELDLMPMPDAIGLLRTLIGRRVDDDPAGAMELARQCSRLPLALRIAAELAVGNAAVPLAGLVSELADEQQKLDLLDAGGDARTAVRAVFSWSYRRLAAGPARAFRMAGLHPGPCFDRYAVAALTGTSAAQAGRALEQLSRAHLIQPAGPGRYGLHDLLRVYARDLASGTDAHAERQSALARLMDYYLCAAGAAVTVLFPGVQFQRPDSSAAMSAAPLASPAQARDWLDAHRSTLAAVSTQAVSRGWPDHAMKLAEVLFRYLEGGAHYPELLLICDNARQAARHLGDLAAEAQALNNASLVDLRQGRYREGASLLRQALELYRQSGDQIGQAWALGNLGIVDYLEGRYRQAVGNQRQALAGYRSLGDKVGEARTLVNIALVDLLQGRYQQASSQFNNALALHREVGNRTGESQAVLNLGLIDTRQARYQRAGERLLEALAMFREHADPTGETDALNGLGALGFRLGRHEHAVDYHQAALALARRTGNQAGEAEAHNGLGDVLLAVGEPGRARQHHAMALRMASQIGSKYEQARAHAGLARARTVIARRGDVDGASHDSVGESTGAQHWSEALRLFTALGTPEADQIRVEVDGAIASQIYGRRQPERVAPESSMGYED